MKSGFVLAGIVALTALVSAQKETAKVLYVDAEKVAAALAKGGGLGAAPNVVLSATHRNRAGQAEVHDEETDVMYIQEGEATLTTGGKIPDGKQTAPGQWRGTTVTGGEARRVGKGEIIVIPAGVPHWFNEVPSSISYVVVKVVK